MKKNVVHIITGLGTGGAELMLLRLLRHGSEKDTHQVNVSLVISLTTTGTVGKSILDLDIPIIALNIKGLLDIPVGFVRLILVLRKLRPDSVYTWLYHADFFGGLASYFCGIKNIIWGIRNTQIPQGSIFFTSLIIKMCSKLSYKIPKHIICCAEAAKETHINLGYCPEKLLVIPNGYDLRAFNPSQNIRMKNRKKLNISDEVKVIGIIGRFDVSKDYHNFVLAASIVSKSRFDVRFFMVGKGLDDNNHELMSWINETGHVDNFILFGECQPHDLLAMMDFYCISSKFEGFPNTVAEAMAMEIPCVVTDVGDAALIVQDTGEVVSAMNPKELADALLRMLELKNIERMRLGTKARNIIETKYSIARIAKKYYQCGEKIDTE